MRLEGKEALAYINKETNKYGAKYYAVRDVDDSKILKYMDSQFNGGRELSQDEKKLWLIKVLTLILQELLTNIIC